MCVCTRCIVAALYLIHLAVLATAASAANTNSGVIHVGTCCAEKYAMILLQLLCPCLYVYVCVCVCVPQLQLKWCQLAAAVNEPIDLPPLPLPLPPRSPWACLSLGLELAGKIEHETKTKWERK